MELIARNIEHELNAAWVRRQDLREIRLTKDRHKIGPPTVTVRCPASKATEEQQGGFKLTCVATLYLAVAPGLDILGERWSVTVNSAGKVDGGKPTDGYGIRGFFEADHVYDCSGGLAAETIQGGAADLESVATALEPCLP